MPVLASPAPATDNGAVDGYGSGSRGQARRRIRRVLTTVLAVVVLAAATAGCAGRKGRNDDDPGPREYSTSVAGAPPLGTPTR